MNILIPSLYVKIKLSKRRKTKILPGIQFIILKIMIWFDAMYRGNNFSAKIQGTCFCSHFIMIYIG